MSTHAFLAPSGAPVWGHCSAAPGMMALSPQEDTDDTRNGEAAHWCAEQKLLTGVDSGKMAPNGVVITDEMREAVELYVQDVWNVVRKMGADCAWGVERHMPMRRIHPTLCAGTVDAFAYSPSQRILTSWNFKFGHREVVEFEDMQEIVYVSGLLDLLNIDGHAEQGLIVDIRIVQPRCYTARGPVRSWRLPAVDLRPYWNKLATKALEATGANPVATSGRHCADCSGRGSCETSRRMTYAAIDYVGKAMYEPLPPAAISFELELLERAEQAIKGRKTAIEELARSKIKGGVTIPGYSLEDTFGRLEWHVSPDYIRMLEVAHGVELFKAPEPITPTQAQKKGIDETVIKTYAKRQPSGLKLVKMDHAAIRRIISLQ